VFTQRYSAAIWLAIYVALPIGASFVSPPVHSPQGLLALAVTSATLFLFLALSVCASLTHVIRNAAMAAVVLGVGLLGLLLQDQISRFGPIAHAAAPALLVLHTLRELFFILAAVGLGSLVAYGIRDRNILLPAAVFAAFADYIVVNYGLVHWALTTPGKGQRALNAMSAHVPSLHPGLPVLTVGFADFLFLSIFFACVFRFHLRLRETFIAFFLLLSLSFWVVIRYGAAVPALAPMALGFVAANFKCFKLSREEMQAMAAAAAIVLIAALFLILRRPHARPQPPSPPALPPRQRAMAFPASEPSIVASLTVNGPRAACSGRPVFRCSSSI
jgi:hypothetical protein